MSQLIAELATLAEIPTTDPVTTYTPFESSNQILSYPPETLFRIYYLEAPLSVLGERIGITFTNSLLEINGFHTAVGFQAIGQSNPLEFTYGLDLANGFAISSFVPEITYPNGVPTLRWRDLNKINQGSAIDRNYWDKCVYISTQPAEIVTRLQEWILDQWIPNNPIYSILSGIRSRSTVDIFDPIFRASFCDSFCYAMFDYLGRSTKSGGLNRCIDYPVVPNTSVNAFIESYPGAMQPVIFENNREEIVEFYLRLEATLAELSDLEAETIQLIQDLAAGGADESTILRLVAQELFTAISLVATVYEGFNVIYYYGYGPTGTNQENTPTYWRIEDPQIYLAYINGPLQRSYPSVNTSGQRVHDGHSDGSPQGCQGTLLCPPIPISNQNTVTRSASSHLAYWIAGGILFTIIILVVAGSVYVQSRKNRDR
jgi:hypothetical protein